ncbi:MAG: glycosyltransferase, partial [Alphaproteobacteria bacterium]
MLGKIRLTAIVVALLVACANLGVWAVLNRPVEERPWWGRMNGISYSPFREGQSPLSGDVPTAEQIEEDIEVLAPHVARLRTYSTLGGIDRVAGIAKAHGMPVTVGGWIEKDLERNEREVAGAIRLARKHKNVDRILVGNESLLRNDVTVAELVAYLRRVRSKVWVPVSTAEPWHVWLKHPELAQEVDFIAIHVLPYWEGTPHEAAVDHILERLADIKRAFPGKHVALTEVGWPSDGRIKRQSVPSATNQATFLRQFLNVAEAQKLDYYVMEAFDQPWKLGYEGSVGAYWGLFDADRRPKFPMSGPVIGVASWPLLATVSTALAILPALWLLGRMSTMRFAGQLFYAAQIQASASAVVWAGHLGLARYFTPSTIVSWLVLCLAFGLVIVVLLTEGFELVEALWRSQWRRRFPAAAAPVEGFAPKVSIHVPTCDEPPQMVIQTLEALARLDYPDFEVLVIDNNTSDARLWQPVRDYCAGRGPPFKFLHLDWCPGFKAGALNVALRHMDPAAEIVAVVDSDYVVEPDWLRALVPYFARPEVGFVQAPQDYRDGGERAFKGMCYWEYAAFFHVGMVQRNERNAIIQHGTMTLIRKDALRKVHDWAEWCITEDTELGLRLLEAGYESMYVQHSFGRGLTPDSLSGYKSQRFRWAYGAVQIMKRHWRALLPWARNRLDWGQRYHYAAGWLPWFADALNLLFTVFGLAWSLGVILWPKQFELPLLLFLMGTLSLFAFKSLKALWLYATKIRCGLASYLGASIAGLALSHTIAKAVWSGLFTSNRPFLRTPKCERMRPLIKGLAMAWEESLLMLLLWAAAGAVALTL